MEHPQTNGLAQFANQVILERLKKRLDLVKGAWVKELPYVLWSYKITIDIDTKETPSKLTVVQDTITFIEIRQTLDQVLNYFEKANDRLKAKNLDFLKEDKEMAHIQ